jgi:uncharacterized repeat protein (TIGR03803 family)
MVRKILLFCLHHVTEVVLTWLLAASAFGAGPGEQVLYSFSPPSKPCCTDGAGPEGALVADAEGNLFGTTGGGGAADWGTVFELSPPATEGGSWTERVIYTFFGTAASGMRPYGSPIMDQQGNLYGTTQLSGPDENGSVGPGSVFKLTRPAKTGGRWKYTQLFTVGSVGVFPVGNLALDEAGNIYGTIPVGGSGAVFDVCSPYYCGDVFQFTPPATEGGTWMGQIIYSFGSFAGDGAGPAKDLVLHDGALYGTAQVGGTNGQGTVFQLVQQNGVWRENILHDFTFEEGQAPRGKLIFDAAGNIYGTTYIGDKGRCQFGCGSAFELSPPAAAGGLWQETTLHSFTGGQDGSNPQGGLVRDALGQLFGTTTTGGAGYGVVFELIPPKVSGEHWTEVTLHQFGGAPGDGSVPLSDLILVKGKGLIGTTSMGGSGGAGTVYGGAGTVFSVTP